MVAECQDLGPMIRIQPQVAQDGTIQTPTNRPTTTTPPDGGIITPRALLGVMIIRMGPPLRMIRQDPDGVKGMILPTTSLLENLGATITQRMIPELPLIGEITLMGLRTTMNLLVRDGVVTQIMIRITTMVLLVRDGAIMRTILPTIMTPPDLDGTAIRMMQPMTTTRLVRDGMETTTTPRMGIAQTTNLVEMILGARKYIINTLLLFNI